MHELSITENILKIALEACGGRPIRAIYLRIGELSSFVDDSVQFYFDLLSRDTLAHGAMLHFEREPSTVLCLNCLHTFASGVPLPDACPACRSPLLQVSAGRSLQVTSIEVADEEDAR